MCVAAAFLLYDSNGRRLAHSSRKNRLLGFVRQVARDVEDGVLRRLTDRIKPVFRPPPA